MDVLAAQCPWWLAGVLLGLITIGLQWTANLPLGATGAFVATADFATRPSRGPGWRVFLFLGIPIGALLHTLLAGDLSPTLANGAMDARLGGSVPLKAAVLLAAGAVMGFGARMAGGCTSGHGVCGNARLQPSSMLSTAVFIGTAAATANFLSGVVGV
jgi:hypothetical protein